MARPSEIPISSDTQRDRQELSREYLESVDEELVTTDRATAATNYRGIQPWIFGVAAAGFALVFGLIGATITIAVMALELGRANERVRDLEAVVAEKAEAFNAANIGRIECQAALKQMDGLLDRVAPQHIGGR